MCGIAGFIERKKSVHPAILEAMQGILHHRGPDDKGSAIFTLSASEQDKVDMGVAHVRLSIRDLSPNGHQPMYNQEGNIMIAFNGEIYNSEELRPLLSNKYSFKSTSDTEVLLYLYQEFGMDKTLEMLDGMYAICLVDFRSDTVYLVRDKLGEKPLYYWDNGETFLFASEYKAFYCHPDFKAELEENNIDEYFLFRYVADGGTLLRGVYNLKPGHYRVLSQGKWNEVQYWTLPETSAALLDTDQAKREFEATLKKSVQRRAISDVPVGIQLSGGVDSSVLSYYLKDAIDTSLHTFGVTLKDSDLSEEKYIDYVNEKLNFTPHKISYDSNSFFNTWLESTWYFEQPMNHEGTIGLIKLNREAKKTVSVMLCGEGADESLAGYDRYVIAADNNCVATKIKTPIKWILGKCFGVSRFRSCKSFWPTSNDLDIRYIASVQSLSHEVFYKLRPQPVKHIERLYDERLSIMRRTKSKGLRKYINYELSVYLQDLLMRADKVSMASSLELRVPFIMPELIELESKFPDSALCSSSKRKEKAPNHRTKKVVKDLCASIYGEEFTYRNKCGFYVPVQEYFKSAEAKCFIENKILPLLKKRGLVNYSYVQSLWTKLQSEDIPYDDMYTRHVLWSALSFELWCQMYIDASPLDWQHVLI